MLIHYKKKWMKDLLMKISAHCRIMLATKWPPTRGGQKRCTTMGRYFHWRNTRTASQWFWLLGTWMGRRKRNKTTSWVGETGFGLLGTRQDIRILKEIIRTARTQRQLHTTRMGRNQVATVRKEDGTNFITNWYYFNLKYVGRFPAFRYWRTCSMVYRPRVLPSLWMWIYKGGMLIDLKLSGQVCRKWYHIWQNFLRGKSVLGNHSIYPPLPNR